MMRRTIRKRNSRMIRIYRRVRMTMNKAKINKEIIMKIIQTKALPQM
jgi:hypothetical protein